MLQLVPIVSWSGRADLNRRPPAPKAGALTRLRYVPMFSPETLEMWYHRGGSNARRKRVAQSITSWQQTACSGQQKIINRRER
jgi:hypothetical protein